MDDVPVQNRHWRCSRIMNDVNRTQGWRGEDDLHPMHPDAANTIDRRSVNDVLRVVRNALAHGNVVYLDGRGLETKGAEVQYFVSLHATRKRQNNDNKRKPIAWSLPLKKVSFHSSKHGQFGLPGFRLINGWQRRRNRICLRDAFAMCGVSLRGIGFLAPPFLKGIDRNPYVS